MNLVLLTSSLLRLSSFPKSKTQSLRTFDDCPATVDTAAGFPLMQIRRNRIRLARMQDDGRHANARRGKLSFRSQNLQPERRWKRAEYCRPAAF
jgi:hypothetical protein